MTAPPVDDDPTLWSADRPSDAVLRLHTRAADAGLAPAIAEVGEDSIKMRRLAQNLREWWSDPNHLQEARTAVLGLLVSRINSLHQIGICHCDLHSDNVMIDHDEVFFIDFEFAQEVNPLWPCYDLSGPSEHVPVPQAHATQQGHENGIWWGPAVSTRCLVNVVGPQPVKTERRPSTDRASGD
jgi:serine/threonine protein kinase